jgi:hypothetical protein
MLEIGSLCNFTIETAALGAKRRYTAPALKNYGAVAERTNGGAGSVNDAHTGKFTPGP